MTISTLSLSQDNIDSLANLLDWGYIDELNLIVSAYWFSHERWSLVPYCYERLDKEDKFQLAVAGIHTKTCQFETLGGKRIVIHGSANLRSSGKEDGRYYIGFDGTETNHALNANRVKGKLYIYDQQINGSYDLLALLREAKVTSMEVLRLDNLLFDTTYIDQWITAR